MQTNVGGDEPFDAAMRRFGRDVRMNGFIYEVSPMTVLNSLITLIDLWHDNPACHAHCYKSPSSYVPHGVIRGTFASDCCMHNVLAMIT